MNTNSLRAGFSRVNVTPSIGTPIIGYYIERKVCGVLDELEINSVMLETKGGSALLMSIDNCGIGSARLTPLRKRISDTIGIPCDSIFIASTHTHNGPGASLTFGENDDMLKEYWKLLLQKCVDAAVLAKNDLRSARIGYGEGEAKNVAFIRRFRMKDGSIKTNPGVHNPDIVAPVGEVDERVKPPSYRGHPP